MSPPTVRVKCLTPSSGTGRGTRTCAGERRKKFQEILKVRHTLEMENEELVHSERNLTEALQFELMKLKHSTQ